MELLSLIQPIIHIMSLPTNNKKGGNQAGKSQKNSPANSKFIKGGAGAAASKPAGAAKKVRSTGANRGS
jgi:hypothetical protein